MRCAAASMRSASQAHSGRWPNSSKAHSAVVARARRPRRSRRAIARPPRANGARHGDDERGEEADKRKRHCGADFGPSETLRRAGWRLEPFHGPQRSLGQRGARLRGGAPAKRELLRAHAESIVPSHPVTGLTRLRIEADIAYSTRALHWA
jgi:hypothetical protein